MQLPHSLSIQKLQRNVSYSLKKIYWNTISAHAQVCFLGPWLGEVGPELQYWIPYIQFLSKRGFFGKQKIIAVSRGGVESWYKNITDHYVDIYDHINIQEYKKLRGQMFGTTQKQASIHPEERALLKIIAEKHGYNRYNVIHPSLIWNQIISWLQDKRTLEEILFQLKFESIRNDSPKYLHFVDKLGLPETFIVARFYSSNVFESSPTTQRVVTSLIHRISRKFPVVVINANYHVDDHSSIIVPEMKNVKLIRSNLPIRYNLGIQTEIVRRSIGFIGTNGGFSVLPGLLGKPVISYYNISLGHYIHLYSKHETMTWILNEQLNQSRYAVIHLNAWKQIFDWLIK